MKKKLSILIATIFIVSICCLFSGCRSEDSEQINTKTAMKGSGKIVDNQPAPNDLEYSLERYNA